MTIAKISRIVRGQVPPAASPALGAALVCFGSLLPVPPAHAEPDIPPRPEIVRDVTFGSDFFDELMKSGDGQVRITLPNGHMVVGKATDVKRDGDTVTAVSGTVQHPEPGDFSFTRAGQPPALGGTLRFSGQSIEWAICPAAGAGRFKFVPTPAPDSFRPRNMKLPTERPPGVVTPAAAREAAEDSLRKSLKIEQVSPGVLRIGLVEIDKKDRTIRFPATVNLRDKAVEYAVVSRKGKIHESLLSTAASPKDVHLALLLLGVKPAACVETADKALVVPPLSAAAVTVEWDAAGAKHTKILAELLSMKSGDSVPAVPMNVRQWQCNGSKFNEAGFAAELDGSIIALMADDMALINNPGADRADDKAHFPNAPEVPPVGTPVTVRLTPPLPASLKETPGP